MGDGGFESRWGCGLSTHLAKPLNLLTEIVKITHMHFFQIQFPKRKNSRAAVWARVNIHLLHASKHLSHLSKWHR